MARGEKRSTPSPKRLHELRKPGTPGVLSQDSLPRPPTHAAASHGVAGQLASDLACLPKRVKRSHFSTDLERVLDILVVLCQVAAAHARELDVPQIKRLDERS